jgi:hypothetical protein
MTDSISASALKRIACPGSSRLLPAVLLFLICLVFHHQTLTAEIFRPLQIFLPGNTSGKLLNLRGDLQIDPSMGWRIPDTIDSFRKNRSRDLLVFASGNDSDMFSPLSFLDNGRFERDFIGHCRPDAGAVGPADLEMFNSSSIEKAFRQRIFTNLDSGEGAELFASHHSRRLGNRTLWFFNFIEASLCAGLPFKTLGTAAIEDPVRAIRRLNPSFSDEDISISTIYGGADTFSSLTAELKKQPGCHLLIHVPYRDQPALFSYYSPEQETNVFRMSVLPGHSSLPLINIFFRNSGYPRLTLRMLPLAKTRAPQAENMHRQAISSLKTSLLETLRVVKTTSGYSFSPRRFSLQSHAHVIKTSSSTDMAIVIPPPTGHINDNVICTGHLLSTINNDRVKRFRISGSEMLHLAEELISRRGIEALAFSGCEIACLAGQITRFNVAGQPLDPNRQYLVGTTEKTLQDSVLAEFTRTRPFESYDGQTVWNCWKICLKTIRLSDKYLFE